MPGANVSGELMMRQHWVVSLQCLQYKQYKLHMHSARFEVGWYCKSGECETSVAF